MTGRIRNPAKLLSPLLPAENEFVRCLAEGAPCVIGHGELPKKEIKSGAGANVVRGEVIRFFAYGGNEEDLILGPEIYLQGAWISKQLDLMHTSIPYALILRNCHFDASVMMQYAECIGFYLDGSSLAEELNADGLTTKGDVNLQSGFSAKGEVRLPGANIGGDFNCEGGRFHNPGGNALFADGMTTKGNVKLTEGFAAEGEVRLLNASIGGSLDCEGGKFHNLGGKALSTDGMTMKGYVHLRDGFAAEGEVRLVSVNIGGNLDCEGGRFHNPGGNALFADGMTTKGSVTLRNGFAAEGEVRLVSASIGINLDCEGGKFRNVGSDALSVDNLTTKGSVHLRNGFSAEGEVRLLGANIGGALDCEDGKFHNPGGNALYAGGLITQGSVILRNGFVAEGEVRLLGANIGGNLSCAGGEFHNADGYALNVNGGNVSGSLFWRKTICEGEVNLGYAKADALADDTDSWKSCKVALNGFTYNRFIGPVDSQFRISWLTKRPDGMEFSSQPYEQAAKILFEMGHLADAWDILREKQRLEWEINQSSWLQRAWEWTIGTLTDFVYRPLRTVKWTMGIILAGAAFFGAADHCEQIVPHQPIVLAKAKYQNAIRMGSHPFEATRKAVPDYPGFNPLVFSLDVFIPLFSLHQESYWGPDSGMDDFFRWLTRGTGEFEGWWLLTAWYWIEIMAGWLLSSLLLLSITGLLRPRIGGGD